MRGHMSTGAVPERRVATRSLPRRGLHSYGMAPPKAWPPCRSPRADMLCKRFSAARMAFAPDALTIIVV
eukprot:247555-Prymnesium_polylepis.1